MTLTEWNPASSTLLYLCWIGVRHPWLCFWRRLSAVNGTARMQSWCQGILRTIFWPCAFVCLSICLQLEQQVTRAQELHGWLQTCASHRWKARIRRYTDEGRHSTGTAAIRPHGPTAPTDRNRLVLPCTASRTYDRLCGRNPQAYGRSQGTPPYVSFKKLQTPWSNGNHWLRCQGLSECLSLCPCVCLFNACDESLESLVVTYGEVCHAYGFNKAIGFKVYVLLNSGYIF